VGLHFFLLGGVAILRPGWRHLACRLNQTRQKSMSFIHSNCKGFHSSIFSPHHPLHQDVPATKKGISSGSLRKSPPPPPPRSYHKNTPKTPPKSVATQDQASSQQTCSPIPPASAPAASPLSPNPPRQKQRRSRKRRYYTYLYSQYPC